MAWALFLIALCCGASIGVTPVLGCAGKVPSHLGIQGGALAVCPARPNCVSSDASDDTHHVAPLSLSVAPGQAWSTVRRAVAELPRTNIVADTATYLHAECRSAFFGFVDDLELHLRPDAGQVAVRSGARLGYSDFGVNRGRVETLRRTLATAGVVKP